MEEFDWDLSDDDRRPLPALLYVCFSRSLTHYRDLLHRGKRRGTLDSMAWVTRNILELRVWVEYCSQSRQHAEEFYVDAMRDLNDLRRAVGGIDAEDLKTLNQAEKFIGKSKPAHKFKDVRDAAREVGLWELFRTNNKVLSKFVHPTAMSVVAPIKDRGADRVRKQFVESGTGMLTEAIEKLDASLLGKAYRKYRQTMQRVSHGERL